MPRAYLKTATDRGCVALIASSDPSVESVAPFGGTRRLITPNPLAAGLPTTGDPVLLDISMSTTTNGMVARAFRENRRLPHPWVLDAEGRATDDPAAFFADLWSTVQKAGGALCGSKSLGIRRIEAAILNFGQDFDWQHTPVEIGLGWMVSETKAPFKSQKALMAAKAHPYKQKLAGLRFDGREIPLIGDRIVVDGKERGVITSATGSPALDCPLAIGWLDIEAATPGTPVTVAFGDRSATATVVEMPFLDPERKLSKG